MNWVIALLAFAAIMAVLSTIVTVAVEFVHKSLALRRAGMGEMLRAMHERVLTKLVDTGDFKKKDTRDFARAMMRSPACRDDGGLSLKQIKLTNFIFQPRLERLSNLQFVEQLAKTKIGLSIANLQDRNAIRAKVTRALYEFERAGEAQSDYFGRRAKVIAGLTAFFFVTAANVNAIEIYMNLAAHPEAAQTTLKALDSGNPDSLNQRLENTRVRVRTALQEVDTGLRSAEPNALAGRDALSKADTELKLLQTAVEQTEQDLNRLADIGIPIGSAYFPYCSGANGAEPKVDAATAALTTPGAAPAKAGKKDLCASPPAGLWGPGLVPKDEADAQRVRNGEKLNLIPEKQRLGLVRLDKDWPLWTQRLITQEGFLWLMSMIATAGLLGLGAPFWFDLFRMLSALTGAGRSVPAEQQQKQAEKLVAPATDSTLANTRPAIRDIENMTDAFMFVAGVEGPPAVKASGAYGASSAETLGAAIPSAPPSGPSGMRQARG